MSTSLTRNYDGYGSGFLSPDCRRFYINISKNASSYMLDILGRQGWTSARYGYDSCRYDEVKEMIVVLRDPVDRWTSGVAQYLVTKILNPIGFNTFLDDKAPGRIEDSILSASAFIIAYNVLVERFIFDNLDLLDDHVWLQAEFFEHVLPGVPRRYVIMNNDFESQLNRLGIATFADADRNFSGDDQDKAVLKDFFQRKLDSDPMLLQRVKMTYARDYEIMRNAPPII
jgi:hypothetical protein